MKRHVKRKTLIGILVGICSFCCMKSMQYPYRHILIGIMVGILGFAAIRSIEYPYRHLYHEEHKKYIAEQDKYITEHAKASIYKEKYIEYKDKYKEITNKEKSSDGRFGEIDYYYLDQFINLLKENSDPITYKDYSFKQFKKFYKMWYRHEAFIDIMVEDGKLILACQSCWEQ